MSVSSVLVSDFNSSIPVGNSVFQTALKLKLFHLLIRFIFWQVMIWFYLYISTSLVRSWPWYSQCWCTVKFIAPRSTWTDCTPAVHWLVMGRLITISSGISIYPPKPDPNSFFGFSPGMDAWGIRLQIPLKIPKNQR